MLHTPRLTLVPVRASDAPAIHALFISPGVRRFLWDDEVIPTERTAGVIEESERIFARSRFGLWGAWTREASSPARLVGFGGLWYFRDPPELELLYGVADDEVNRGLATEIATAVVSYARDALGWRELRASTDGGNAASVRVLEKLGFRFERRAVVGGLDTMFYQLAL